VTIIQTDFLVIGGGMAGASFAAELSSANRVVVLEQEEQPGYHATGRSAALHSELYGNAPIRALTRASRAFVLGDEGGESFAQPRGALYIASADQLSALERFAAQPDVASATELVDGKEACSRVPILRADYVEAALREDHAFDLDVHGMHQHFLRLLKARGGQLLCDTPVQSLEATAYGWRVRSGEVEIRASTVVNAAGAWADDIARLAGASPVGLMPRRRTAVLVDPPHGLAFAAWPAVVDIEEQFYFKPDAGKLFLSPADETPSEPCDAYPDELDVAIAVDRVQGAADLPVNRVSHSWAGLRTFAPDRSPVVGYDAEAPRFFWLAGQGGYGIQTAAALARTAAALALGRPVPTDVLDHGLAPDALSPLRFRKTLTTPHAGGPAMEALS
jgi:D-arginine dehydrogenase